MKLATQRAIARRTDRADGLGLTARAAAGPQAIAINAHAPAIHALRTSGRTSNLGIMSRCYVVIDQRSNALHIKLPVPLYRDRPGRERRAEVQEPGWRLERPKSG